jgi:hypothetical protein
MKRGTRQQRQDAIERGISNAVDTVFVDKAMTGEQAFANLKSFIQDTLSSDGLDDTVSEADMKFAKARFPL